MEPMRSDRGERILYALLDGSTFPIARCTLVSSVKKLRALRVPRSTRIPVFPVLGCPHSPRGVEKGTFNIWDAA